MRRLQIAIAASIVSFTTSAIYSHAPDEPPLSRTEAFFEFAENFLRTNTEKPISQKISKMVDSEQGPNAPIDYWHARKFRGFELTHIKRENGNQVFVGLVVFSNRVKLPFGIQIGDSLEKVVTAMGPPRFPAQTNRDPKLIIQSYSFGNDGFSNYIYFNFKAGRLVRVEWQAGFPD